ncbi:alpha-galactosidase [Streptomyces millisiae]|uniref:Alpha-galactosidase n=1 Tax=Streptomyces millisiae TaxID=3075542 RepID=A0ABU2LIT0_9ACTN|nr:alpha-galactosidase [Streptomyces sp. DSM 44918]MDT0317038.1 alpha-galactosidase [Streptomyces sp. DSM 44918]
MLKNATEGEGVVRVRWGHEALGVEVAAGPDGPPRLVALGPAALAEAGATPLVEVLALGEGSEWSGQRGIESSIGARLRLVGHETARDGDWHRLALRLRDETTGLAVEVLLDSPDGVPVVRSRTRVTNEGPNPVTLLAVSSLSLGGLPSPDVLDVYWAENDWLAECRWRHEPLRTRVPDLSRARNQKDSRGRVGYASRGSWSTDGHLPMGALVQGDGGAAWLWQVESSTGWLWEVGERSPGSYLALHGPTDTEHQWRQPLAPGGSFTTEPAALAVGGDLTAAFGALTAYRRAVRRPHEDHRRLPIVFNDFMNTLNGDPTTAKLLPLIDAAAEVGAEYFVIDAGWYDDDTQGWWDSVGAWEPAANRFPGEHGIHEVLDRIRAHGMVPGLWLEPEVIGVRSPLAKALPAEAFFRREGVRVREHGRYQLDLRHPAAVAHLDRTVDRIVGEWGVGYLKLDYNISVPPGTDTGGTTSPGAGLLGHARAYRAWLGSLLDRHPHLVLENCASGGMRMDGALHAVTQLQSTSDQQDHLRYPPIAAAAPTAVPPEQGAVWAYAQPEFTTDENAFVLASALLGRIHLSGHLNRMTDDQLASVRDALNAYGEIRPDLPHATPFWPLGLPRWTDDWTALGLTAGHTRYLTIWRRAGEPHHTLPLPELAGHPVRVEMLHPAGASDATTTWSTETGELTVTLPRTPTALLLRLTPTAD